MARRSQPDLHVDPRVTPFVGAMLKKGALLREVVDRPSWAGGLEGVFWRRSRKGEVRRCALETWRAWAAQSDVVVVPDPRLHPVKGDMLSREGRVRYVQGRHNGGVSYKTGANEGLYWSTLEAWWGWARTAQIDRRGAVEGETAVSSS